ncbi:MAG: hypothetical protein WED85_00245 [Dehalococcoidia bacterium]
MRAFFLPMDDDIRIHSTIALGTLPSDRYADMVGVASHEYSGHAALDKTAAKFLYRYSVQKAYEWLWHIMYEGNMSEGVWQLLENSNRVCVGIDKAAVLAEETVATLLGILALRKADPGREVAVPLENRYHEANSEVFGNDYRSLYRDLALLAHRTGPLPLILIAQHALGQVRITSEEQGSVINNSMSDNSVMARLVDGCAGLTNGIAGVRRLKSLSPADWEALICKSVSGYEDNCRELQSVQTALRSAVEGDRRWWRQRMGTANPADGLWLAAQGHLEIRVYHPSWGAAGPKPARNQMQKFMNEAAFQFLKQAFKGDRLVVAVSAPFLDADTSWLCFLPLRFADQRLSPVAYLPPPHELFPLLADALPAYETANAELRRRQSIESLVFFEGLRQQVVAEEGLICPLWTGPNRCCGRREQLIRLFEAGEAAKDRGSRIPCWNLREDPAATE